MDGPSSSAQDAQWRVMGAEAQLLLCSPSHTPDARLGQPKGAPFPPSHTGAWWASWPLPASLQATEFGPNSEGYMTCA